MPYSEMAAKSQGIEKTEEFIILWREEICLWDIRSPLYRNRDTRQVKLTNFDEMLSLSGMHLYVAFSIPNVFNKKCSTYFLLIVFKCSWY